MPANHTCQPATARPLISRLLLGTLLLSTACVAAASDARASAHPRAPALSVAPVPCAQPASPARRGDALMRSAQASLERYPFDSAAGLQGLSQLSEALLCLQAAGNLHSAHRAALQFARFQQQLDRDYRQYQARLQVALDREQTADATREARALLLLLAGHDDAYTTWLMHVARGAP